MIVLGLVGYAFGIDPRILIGGAESSPRQPAPTYQTDRRSGPADRRAERRGRQHDLRHSRRIGRSLERDLQASGQTYTGPRIVLSQCTNGGRCGMAQARWGRSIARRTSRFFSHQFLP